MESFKFKIYEKNYIDITKVFQYNYKRMGEKRLDDNNINVLINEARLNKRIEEIAEQIENEYKGEEIVFIGVLRGAVPFMWELAKRIKNNITFEFIEVSSYEGTESTGKIKINKDITNSIKDKNIIIVEDIIDTGRTLTFLKEYIKEKGAKTIKIATLLSKPSRRIMDLDVNYIGFKIEDKFVVGFGLDYNQRYRNLPYIGYIEEN